MRNETKPRVFIGSSAESLTVAYALQAGLEHSAEVTVWSQGVFSPSQFALESLLQQLDSTDIGVFVFAPDDIVRLRDVAQSSVRDNVLFEFGLFAGRLGRQNTFIVIPKGMDFHIASDLLGLNMLKFDSSRSDDNWEAALGPASHRLRQSIKRFISPRSRFPPESEMPILEVAGLISAKQRSILFHIYAKDSVSKPELSEAFPNFTDVELHYRLEQLRLLTLVEAKSVAGTPGDEVRYFLTKIYMAALKERDMPSYHNSASTSM